MAPELDNRPDESALRGRLCGFRVTQRAVVITLVFSFLAAEGATQLSLNPPPPSLHALAEAPTRSQFFDRGNRPLSYTYDNRWNVYERIPLERVPPKVMRAFLAAEDGDFFEHGGADPLSLLRATLQNLRSRRFVSGASTITEQIAKLLAPTPRRRTVWTRWLELREALVLERRFSKGELLEFYLNQVPYARNRRGIVSAARSLFDRDLDTLSMREALALAVLVRAPGALDPLTHGGETGALTQRIDRLLDTLLTEGAVTEDDARQIRSERIVPSPPQLEGDASHFLRFVSPTAPVGRVQTTLDATLQLQVQHLLDTRLRQLRGRGVTNGAALVVENQSGEILSWVNAQQNGAIDGVLTPRQPGSTLKPFLYALAFERGASPATIVHDEPLARPVGVGVKRFQNSSGLFYGPVRMRDSLGNSLNIPAVETILSVGVKDFFSTLRALRFDSLHHAPEFYGEGLALGNGEVSLFELVRAYRALATGGRVLDLIPVRGMASQAPTPDPVFTEAATSLIANILSDPAARSREFHGNTAFATPMQTALKTGTSTDYRDAWCLGFTSRHTVGVWLGNLDRTAMHEVTGSKGPAWVVRGIFKELGTAPPLSLSNKLVSREICSVSGALPGQGCPRLTELFLPGTEPKRACHDHAHPAPAPTSDPIALELPTPGLRLARDPRIPDHLEALPLTLPAGVMPHRTEWLVDDTVIGATEGGERQFLWKLLPGIHTARARFWLAEAGTPIETAPVQFTVQE